MKKGSYEERKDDYNRTKDIWYKTQSIERNKIDKLLFTLNLGGFGISLTFLKITGSVYHYSNLLYFTWGSFILSMVFLWLSSIFSEKEHVHLIEELDKQWNKNEDPYTIIPLKYICFIKTFNFISSFATFIGLGLFVGFVFLNDPLNRKTLEENFIQEEIKMSEKKIITHQDGSIPKTQHKPAKPSVGSTPKSQPPQPKNPKK